MTIPEAIVTTTAREVVKSVAFRAARSAIDDLLDSGQIEGDDALELTEQVSKALLGIDPNAGTTEVLKSLNYGVMTTDAALMTGGAALTIPSEPAELTEYARRRIAKALFDDTQAGLSPVSKALGYVVPEDMEEFRTDVGDVFMQEFGVNTDDALACAQLFFDHYQAR